MDDQTPGAVKAPLEAPVRPHAEAYARWLADTHAPALRSRDSEGAFGAAWVQAHLLERERINLLVAAIREHWIKANGFDSMSVAALDAIAEVIADGSYVRPGA